MEKDYIIGNLNYELETEDIIIDPMKSRIKLILSLLILVINLALLAISTYFNIIFIFSKFS